MVTVDPRLLEARKKSSQRSTPSNMTYMLASIKSLLARTILKVSVEGDDFYRRAFQTVVQKLDLLAKNGASTIAKADMQGSEITNLNITNLEKVNIEKFDKISLSLKEIDGLLAKIDKLIAASKDVESTTSRESALVRGMISQLFKSNNQAVRELESIAAKEINFPKVQTVEGRVEVTKMPAMREVVEAVEGLKKSLASFQKIEKSDNTELAKALEEIEKTLSKIPEKLENFGDNTHMRVTVDNFPPAKYPLPVTNININPLRGFAKSTAVNISSTTPIPLPGTALANRRGIVLYNTSATLTLYIGGSDVTAANGMPIPPGSYSPALDAGVRMIVYGITASGTIDVRVLEVSNENIGG